jgi:hypothetical protein
MPDYPIVEYTRKHLLVAKAGLKATLNFSSLSNFGLVYQDLAHEAFHQQPCYGALSLDRREALHAENNPCILFYDRPGYLVKVDKALQKDYLTWLMNESVFRHAFISKSWHLAKKYGAVYSTQYPIQYVLQAAKAVRYMGEKPGVVQMWGRLSPHMDKNAALFLAHFIHDQGPDHFVLFDGYIGGHHMFDVGHFGCRGLKRVVEEDFSAFNHKSFAEKPHGYQNQGLIWGKLKAGEAYKPITLPAEAAKVLNRQDLFGQPIQLRVFRWKDIPETGPLIVKHNLEKLGDAP